LPTVETIKEQVLCFEKRSKAWNVHCKFIIVTERQADCHDAEHSDSKARRRSLSIYRERIGAKATGAHENGPEGHDPFAEKNLLIVKRSPSARVSNDGRHANGRADFFPGAVGCRLQRVQGRSIMVEHARAQGWGVPAAMAVGER
jgi:hypothetical protein